MQRPKAGFESVVAAWRHAEERSEPTLYHTTAFADDRGWSIMNQFQEVLSSRGQINVSAQYPGIVKAWHRHQMQTDFWLVVLGHLKAGIYREEDGETWMTVLGEKQPGVLIVPKGLWHGCATVGPTTAVLIYYVTEAFNPAQPDEERRSFDSVAGFSWEPKWV